MDNSSRADFAQEDVIKLVAESLKKQEAMDEFLQAARGKLIALEYHLQQQKLELEKAYKSLLSNVEKS